MPFGIHRFHPPLFKQKRIVAAALNPGSEPEHASQRAAELWTVAPHGSPDPSSPHRGALQLGPMIRLRALCICPGYTGGRVGGQHPDIHATPREFSCQSRSGRAATHDQDVAVFGTGHPGQASVMEGSRVWELRSGPPAMPIWPARSDKG